MANLDPLPPSNDEYWEHSEIDTVQLQGKRVCEHEFKHQTALEVECVKCRMGFVLSPGMVLRDKHIYFEDQFIV